MAVVNNNQLLPGDSHLVDHIVGELKSQGIFDQFRKECIADVDTKPAYQNLRQRVEGNVANFLSLQKWKPDMNKNQLREMLRKNIQESGFLETGVERIVDQVVNPKINTTFFPQVEDVVYEFLGMEKPEKSSCYEKSSNGMLSVNTDLLPTDLDPISPCSDKTHNRSIPNTEETNGSEKMEDSFKIDEEESPPFEPIENVSFSMQDDESMDSHLSGISGLTSHDSNHSTHSQDKFDIPEMSNPESQLSKVSSNSRLSIVTNDGKDSPDTYKPLIYINRSFNPPPEADATDSSCVIHIKMDHDQRDKLEINIYEKEICSNSENRFPIPENNDKREKIFTEKELDCKNDMGNILDKIKTELETPLSNDDITDKRTPDSSSDDNNIVERIKQELMDEKPEVNDLKDILTCDDIKLESCLDSGKNKESEITVPPQDVQNNTVKAEIKSPERLRKDSERHRSSKHSLSKDHRDDKERKRERHSSSSSASKGRDKDRSKDSGSRDSRSDKEKNRRDSKRDSRSDVDEKSNTKDDKSRDKDESTKDKDEKLKEKEERVEKSRDRGDKSSSKGKDRDDKSKSKDDKYKDDKSKNKDSKRDSSSSSYKNSTDDKRKSSSKHIGSSSNHESRKSSSSKDYSSRDKSKTHKSSGDTKSKDQIDGVKDSTTKQNEDRKSKDNREKYESKDKDVKSKPSERDRNKSECSKRSSSHRSSSSHDRKKDSKKDNKKYGKDDHCNSKDKHSEARRSTDRDSNDGASGNCSQGSSSRSSSHSLNQKSKDNSEENSNGSQAGESGGPSDVTSEKGKETSGVTSKSPVKLEISAVEVSITPNVNGIMPKKRAHPDDTLDMHQGQFSTQILDGQIQVKLKKPKFASNIFEARRLMKIRKRLEKLERQRQRQLNQTIESDCFSPGEDSVDSLHNGIIFSGEENQETEVSDHSNNSPRPKAAENVEIAAKPVSPKVQQIQNKTLTTLPSKSKTGEEAKIVYSDEDEDCLYFTPKNSPTAERFLKQIATLGKQAPKLAGALSDDTMSDISEHSNAGVKPTRRSRKPNMKYCSEEYTSDASFLEHGITTPVVPAISEKKGKYTRNAKKSIAADHDILETNENNNIKTGRIKHNEVPISSPVDQDEPSPTASSTSLPDVEIKPVKQTKGRKIKKRTSTANDTFTLPPSPDSDVSASSGEQKRTKATKDTDIIPTKLAKTDAKAAAKTAKSAAQRYSSDDLYKPRPVIGTTRRSRAAQGNATSRF